MRRKLLIILLMLAIYRIGCFIGLPYVDAEKILNPTDSNNLFAFITGGGQGTIFAMGIGPYITSSIVMQLLTVAIPALERIQKEGEEGRKKINQITRFVAVGLSALQAAGTVYSMNNQGMFVGGGNWFVWITGTVSLITGSMFIMWIAELLTERGVGNGSSFIIFANILANLPQAVSGFVNYAINSFPVGAIVVLVLVALFIAVMGFVTWIQDGERRIPVQYSKKMVGRQMYGGQSSFIPIKVNIAGVMSIIFAISLLQFPQQLNQFFQWDWLTATVDFLSISATTSHPSGAHPVAAAIYVFLIFAFTFFYTSFAINPVEMAENMKKNGGFVPGIRPGKPTSDYIQRTVDRLSWIGAVFYALVALVPLLAQWIFGISVGFGGTTLLIVTGVALELVKQLESQLLLRHHKGFLS
ncbi:MAG: preprotein translocase subunit SecY [Clostridiales bacterium]|nr:preprotein translocase subunit SecY [Clostridiales bacterium]